MNFQQYPVTKVVTIDGEEMLIPISSKFITIDWTGSVQAWDLKPHCSDGWWSHSDRNVRSIIVGEAKGFSIGCYEVA